MRPIASSAKIFAMSGFEDPVAMISAWPALALPLFAFLSSFLEYVFPPYLGDVAILLLFFLAGQGAVPVAWVFAGAFLGGVVGSAAAFVLGRRYGMGLVQRMTRQDSPESQERMRRTFQRYGEPILLINRFLPVLRSLLLYGAGALHLRYYRSILFSAISGLAWTTLLMAAGVWTAGSWEQIQQRFAATNQALGIAALAAFGLWCGWALLRWRLQSRRLKDRKNH